MKYIAVGMKMEPEGDLNYKFIGEERDNFEDVYKDFMEKARDYPIAEIEIYDGNVLVSKADIIPERRL